MRVLLVDDEEPARARMRRLLRAERDVEVVAEAANGEDAARIIDSIDLDAVFLDVQMPRLDGFATVKQVTRSDMPAIVFVTAYDQYALQAFEVQALDYLLKPVAAERLRSVIERIRGRATPASLGAAVAQVERAAKLARPRYLEHVLVEGDGRATFVPAAEIDIVRAERNYVTLHRGDTTYVLRSTLQLLESELDPGKFVRINRSELVRVAAIAEMYAWSHGDYRVMMSNGMTLTWGRRYRKRER